MLPFLRVGGVDLGRQLLDTGASYVRITSRIRAQINAFRQVRTDLSFGILALERTALSAPLPVSVGSAGATDVTVQAANWAALGGSFLNRFVIGMPAGGRELRLTPNPGVPLERFSILHRLGLQLYPEDARRVTHVEPGSVADAAGLNSTTRLVAVNGRPVGALGYLGACAELEDPGRHQWDLQVRQGWGWGAVREVRLKAE
jgi:hypothetical protein